MATRLSKYCRNVLLLNINICYSVCFYIVLSHAHINAMFTPLRWRFTTQSSECKESELCQVLLPLLKPPAWLNVCWSCWQSAVPQPWCPITYESFLAKGCADLRFSQTCFIATVRRQKSALSYSILDTVWRHPNVLGQCLASTSF